MSPYKVIGVEGNVDWRTVKPGELGEILNPIKRETVRSIKSMEEGAVIKTWSTKGSRETREIVLVGKEFLTPGSSFEDGGLLFEII